MSAANVEIVRSAMQARYRGAMDEAISHFDPAADIDYSEMRGPYGGRHYQGGEGFIEVEELVDDAWGVVEWEIKELIDDGDEVIGIFHMRGQGRASGLSVEASGAGIFSLRDGKIVRYIQCQDLEDAQRVLALERSGS